MSPILWWVIAVLLILVGIFGVFLPAIPGVLVIFGGMLLAAWIDDFQRIGWLTLGILGLLTALALLADVVGGLLGAQRVGASRLALSLVAKVVIVFAMLAVFVASCLL